MIINERYDFNFIKNLLSLYDYKARLYPYGITVMPCGSNSFYQLEIICNTDDYKYENGGNLYINRFSIEFAGFGNCDKEKEDLIYNNIVKAKQVVDILNKYIDKCNQKEDMSEMGD